MINTQKVVHTYGLNFRTQRASLVVQLVKDLPALGKTWIWSPGCEDPLEKGKATHSSILAWRIPWTMVHGVANRQTWLSDSHYVLRIKYPDNTQLGNFYHNPSKSCQLHGAELISWFFRSLKPLCLSITHKTGIKYYYFQGTSILQMPSPPQALSRLFLILHCR